MFFVISNTSGAPAHLRQATAARRCGQWRRPLGKSVTHRCEAHARHRAVDILAAWQSSPAS
jgi:hypothetical protein